MMACSLLYYLCLSVKKAPPNPKHLAPIKIFKDIQPLQKAKERDDGDVKKLEVVNQGDLEEEVNVVKIQVENPKKRRTS